MDVSGFTALTERLASKGKAGAEEVSDLVSGCFTELLDIAADHGGDMLKWGGDAALLFYAEPGSAARAGRAAWRMCRLMERIGTLRTSLGSVTLRVSIGVHRGAVDFYLLGQQHRELIVTGPAASAVARMEALAEAGDVVVSADTAAALPPGCVGAPKQEGLLLAAEPGGLTAYPPVPPVDFGQVDLGVLFPPLTREHLLGGGESCEHRHAAVAFIEFSGVDALVAAEGPGAVAASLGAIVGNTQASAAAEGVNFHASDVGPDGGKLLVLGGIPVVRGNDEERVLRCALSIVGAGGGQLRLRAGVNAGRVFMHESGPAQRRIHSFAGDAVNLAARVMGKAAHGQVLATATILERTRSTFDAQALEPFSVKGKAEPVHAWVIGAARRRVTAGETSASELVGRDDELALVLELARRAASGTGAALEITAEPGMGKSTLVAAATGRWPLRTYRLVSEEYGRSTPYLPFRWLLRAVLGAEEDAASAEVEELLRAVVAERAPELAPWMALVGDVLGVALPATAEVEELDERFMRARLEQSVVDLLKAVVDRPSAFVFEDTHELDDASRALLWRVAGEARTRPWLVLTTRRPEGEPMPADLLAAELALTPLGPDAARSLMRRVGLDLALSPQDEALLIDRAAGNPLFLHELTLAAERAGSAEQLPDRLESLLAAKIDRLDPADRQLLRAAAVLGIRFDPAMAVGLIGGEEDGTPAGPRASSLAAPWERLGEFVVEESGGAKRFAHALVREAAYEGLSFRRRRHLHGRAADAVAATAEGPGDQADLISLHSLHAERFADAWRFGCLAGDRARSIHANAEAIVFYERALTAARHLRHTPPADLSRVAEALGDAAEMAGRFDVARGGYDRARGLCRSSVDRARLLRKTALLHERAGRYRQALGLYSRARTLAAAGDRSVEAALEQAEIAVAYAGVRFRQGRMGDCEAWTETCIRQAEAAGDKSILAHGLFLGDLARIMCGAPWGPALERALSIYEDLGDAFGQANALNNMGIGYEMGGNWPRALDCHGRAMAARQRAGDAMGVATQENNIGEILSHQGHYEQAEAHFDAARTGWRAARYRIATAVAEGNLGRLYVRSGRVARGVSLLDRAADEMRAIGAGSYVIEITGWLVEAAVWAGPPERALDLAAAHVAAVASSELAESLGPSARTLLAVARHRAGDRKGAGHELRLAVDAAERRQSPYPMAMALATRCSLGLGSQQSNRSDGRRAVELMEILGIVDTPVTSLEDRWPRGDRARGLLIT